MNKYRLECRPLRKMPFDIEISAYTAKEAIDAFGLLFPHFAGWVFASHGGEYWSHEFVEQKDELHLHDSP